MNAILDAAVIFVVLVVGEMIYDKTKEKLARNYGK